MDRPGYLEEDYSSLDGLDDDVFHSDDFGLAGQPGEMTATGIFTQNQSYSCLLGRFQLFPLTHCCGPGIRHPEQQDKATQTLSPSSSSQDVMLPCGVTEEPRRLFYGNAGYRLHVPPVGFALDPHLQEEPREGQREARAEVQIARKLQCIADQFHRLHIQRSLTEALRKEAVLEMTPPFITSLAPHKRAAGFASQKDTDPRGRSSSSSLCHHGKSCR